ncbi:hypothetical protein JCGZ_16862 [Jatropha curcas]|uniref:Uncharacterized protein n=1 Tax=Jatropha curcas TaxID=180498 RepID=A0A067LG86_JATCU|nr:putative disease resistance protein RGA1 [Jatropha curcas]KDP43575.1 hypothetical protein JCGZ_16862 [Jatropha curcas]
MAEGVVFGIADEIITKLDSEAIQELSQLRGFKDEMEMLKAILHRIKAVVLDAEERSSRDTQIKAWLEMLKSAVFSVDDMLDDFYTEALRRQSLTGNRIGKELLLFFSHSNRLFYGLKMIRKVKRIKRRLCDIAESSERFHLETRLSETGIVSRQGKQSLSSLPERIIGRDTDMIKIIEFLLRSDYEEDLTIISITGVAGLGKTTLAQYAYNDEKVNTHFELKLWISVSDNFDVKLIVESILEKMTNERHKNFQMDILTALLREKISRKKYLIVLDDVWNEDTEKWLYLKGLLLGGAKGSKIMITTRLKKVAEIAHSILVHELRPLSENESWLFLKQMALEQGLELSLNLEAIGKEIVRKCEGIPLAIRTMGDLLLSKNTEAEWQSFKENELSRMGDSDILPALRMSYDNLPFYLKYCFAYCSIFPADYKIDVEMLIHLWMAQEYVEASDLNQSLENIGFEYFMDLLNRFFFQEVEKERWGTVKTCRMHDLMHDLATLVAGKESITLSVSHSGFLSERARHVSVVFDDDIVWDSLARFGGSMVRTLLFLSKRSSEFVEEQLHGIFSKFKNLRALYLHDQGIEMVPHSICRLKHLRYLDLSHNRVLDRLPISIGRLHNLQVLNLVFCYGLRELPNSIIRLQNLYVLKLDYCTKLEKLPQDIKKLVNLRHLGLYGCHGLTHIPGGIAQLTLLEKLSRFVAVKDNSASMRSSRLSELQGLNNLGGILEIVNLKYVKSAECRIANLREKQHLQVLILQWIPFGQHGYDLSGDDIDNEEMVLEGLRPHQNLKELVLYAYGGVRSPSWLASITNLESITFKNCPRITMMSKNENDNVQWQGLKNLRSVELKELPELASLPEGLQYVITLQRLTIGGCPKLISLPDWIANLTALQHLDISDCPQLSDICRNKGEGWPNIAHIPNIVV